MTTTTEPTTEEDALWASIGEMPECQLRRGVAADWYEERSGKVECNRCSGRGVESVYERGEYGPNRYQQDCPTCTGTGYIPDRNGRMAAALRATAAKHPDIVSDPMPFVWWTPPGVGVDANIIEDDDVFDRLTPEFDTTDRYGVPGQVDRHKHYPTTAAAIRDLCEAWCKVNYGEVRE